MAKLAPADWAEHILNLLEPHRELARKCFIGDTPKVRIVNAADRLSRFLADRSDYGRLSSGESNLVREIAGLLQKEISEHPARGLLTETAGVFSLPEVERLEAGLKGVLRSLDSEQPIAAADTQAILSAAQRLRVAFGMSPAASQESDRRAAWSIPLRKADWNTILSMAASTRAKHCRPGGDLHEHVHSDYLPSGRHANSKRLVLDLRCLTPRQQEKYSSIASAKPV